MAAVSTLTGRSGTGDGPLGVAEDGWSRQHTARVWGGEGHAAGALTVECFAAGGPCVTSMCDQRFSNACEHASTCARGQQLPPRLDKQLPCIMTPHGMAPWHLWG